MSNDAYSFISKFYDSVFDSLNASLRVRSRQLIEPLEGMKVLDVGCGTGTNLLDYQQAGCDVYGIDMSPSMMEIAREKLGDKVNLHQGDASQMPYEDNFFDLVTSTLMLHELRPSVRDAIVKEMIRTVKAEGHILLIDFHPGSLRFPAGWWSKVVITISEIIAGQEHFRNYRQFMATKGLLPLINDNNLLIKKQKIVSGGNMVLILLTKS